MVRTLLFSAGLLIGVAFALPAAADEAYATCSSSAETSGAQQRCAENWVERERAAVALAWRRALQATPERQREALQAEQTAWEAYEGRACAVYRAGDDAGFYESVELWARCRADVLSARTRRLQQVYADFGDA